MLTYFECLRCHTQHPPQYDGYICSSCGSNLAIAYDLESVRQVLTKEGLQANPVRDVWRYQPILPVEPQGETPMVQVGWTPLYQAKALAKTLNIHGLYIKDDSRNPSASFKDRASMIALSHALRRKESVICTASTGNAASSLACLSANAPIQTVIFVPERAPKAKVAQLLAFGARVVMVKGTYDEAFDLCVEAARKFGWYNRNTGYNPYTREGKKTCSFEIAEQMDWQPPDQLFVPVGDGNIISGLWKGWKELHALGLIPHTPKLVAVQAEHSNAIAKAFETGREIEAVSGDTVADSISVSIPRDGFAALQALKESEGYAVTVTDEEILSAIIALAQATGVFAEPAGAASYAGLKKAITSGQIGQGQSAAILVTGSGLKDVESAMKATGEPFLISPRLSSLQDILDKVIV